MEDSAPQVSVGGDVPFASGAKVRAVLVTQAQDGDSVSLMRTTLALLLEAITEKEKEERSSG